MRTPTLTAGLLHPQPKLKEVVSLGGWGRPRNESRMLQLDDSDLGGGPRLGTSTPFPHIEQGSLLFPLLTASSP